MTEEIFTKSPLDKEEQWYENQSKEFVPMRNQEQLQKELMRSAPKNRESRKKIRHHKHRRSYNFLF